MPGIEEQIMSIRGAYRQDGSWIGYDYERQAWIDTSPSADRDETCSLGSACNPLASIPELEQWQEQAGGMPV